MDFVLARKIRLNKKGKKFAKHLLKFTQLASENKCPHKKTVAINEEGHAGVYCVFCGEKLEDAC